MDTHFNADLDSDEVDDMFERARYGLGKENEDTPGSAVIDAALQVGYELGFDQATRLKLVVLCLHRSLREAHRQVLTEMQESVAPVHTLEKIMEDRDG